MKKTVKKEEASYAKFEDCISFGVQVGVLAAIRYPDLRLNDVTQLAALLRGRLHVETIPQPPAVKSIRELKPKKRP